MKHSILTELACLVLFLLAPAATGAAECPPSGQSKSSLQALRSKKFEVGDPAEKRKLADGLLTCLADPDPELRDEIAYEGLTQWMRAGDIDAAGLREWRDRLYGMLDEDNGPGFRQPFAALVLSEVARTDRVGPNKAWMTAAERTSMVERAASYVQSVRDYRGYNAREGWRHGVAHGADWLMQLTLNPALERSHYDRILSAIATQVAPEPGHAYIFGEPGRLARPVLFTAERGLLSEAEWTTWFTGLVSKAGKPGPSTSGYAAWLDRRHDLMGFLTTIYVEVDTGESANIRALKPAIAAALKAAR